MDSKRLTDERLKELAKPLGDNCWGVTEREGNEMARELLLLRADAAELARAANLFGARVKERVPSWFDEPTTSTDFAEARDSLTELLSRPSVVNLMKEKDGNNE